MEEWKMQESVSIQKYSPFELCDNELPKHIVFDQLVEKQYEVIRKSTHDGTLIFTKQVLDEALGALIHKKTYHIPSAPADKSTVKDLNYVIGEVELKSEFGMVDLPVGRIFGQTDTVTIPVKCIYILKEG
jgi:hypothetical protein